MKFSFSPRPGVTFPNFWFSLNECSDNNHYFWTKVTCYHICVLLQLNFLLFLRKNSGDDGLAKSHFGSRKNFFMHKWLALSERYGSPLSASSLTTFNDIVLGTWGSKPHDHLSGKSTYIITWCKTLIRATFQSIRKTRIWWSQDFFLPNLTTRWLVCKQSPNIG